jgi:diacylglycerol O-acyltransferase
MEEPEVDERMGAFDAVMWGVEGNPLLRSVIVAMMVLDQDPDMEVARERVELMSLAVPKLRQRAVGNPLSTVAPRWETDPNFDLDYHFHAVQVVDDGTLRPAIEVAERMSEHDFDRYRPAWEVVLVNGLHDGKSAVVVKIHHSITDGVGGMAMAAFLFDLGREPRTDLGPKPDAPTLDVLDPKGRLAAGIEYEGRSIVSTMQALAAGSLGLAKRAAGDPKEFSSDTIEFIKSTGRMLAPADEPLSPVMDKRSLSSTFDFLERPLEPIKQAGKRNGGSLNDAYMAAVAGGLMRYHLRHGSAVPALRVNMPVNLRKPGDFSTTGGNAWAPARFAMPMNTDDAVERIREFHPLLLQARTEKSLVLTMPAMRILTDLPLPITTSISSGMMMGTDFAATNVPGPPVKIFIGGALVEEILVFAPKGGAAINIAFFSYDKRAIVGINMDDKAIPDSDVMMECMNESFDEIVALGE